MPDPIIEIKLVSDDEHLQQQAKDPQQVDGAIAPPAPSSAPPAQPVAAEPVTPNTTLPEPLPGPERSNENPGFQLPKFGPIPLPGFGKGDQGADDDEPAPKKPAKPPEPKPQDFENFEKHAEFRLSELFSPAVVRRWTDHVFGRGLLGQAADALANRALKKKVGFGGGKDSEAEGGTDEQQEAPARRRTGLVDRFSQFLRKTEQRTRETGGDEDKGISGSFRRSTNTLARKLRTSLIESRKVATEKRKQAGDGLGRARDLVTSKLEKTPLGRKALEAGGKVAGGLKQQGSRLVLGVGNLARGLGRVGPRLVAMAGPFAAGIGAFVVTVGAAGIALKSAVGVFRSQADELEEYSGAIVAARLKIETDRISNQIERAERLEVPTAQVEGARGRLEDALYELSTEFRESFAKLAPYVETGVDSLTVMVRYAQLTVNRLQLLIDYASLDFASADRNRKEANEAAAALAVAMTELSLENKEQDGDGQLDWILNNDPFRPLNKNQANPGP